MYFEDIIIMISWFKTLAKIEVTKSQRDERSRNEKEIITQWGKYINCNFNNQDSIKQINILENHNTTSNIVRSIHNNDNQINIGHEIFLIENLLNEIETQSLIEAANCEGFGKTGLPKLYRGNLRLITYDQTLANLLWNRLSVYFPTVITENEKLYNVIGLNECWRYAKYYPGDCFQSHVDGYYKSNDLKSMFTVNIYLNENFDGGETVFLNLKNYQVEDSGQKKVDITVTPRTGLCLVFRQPPTQWYNHEGLTVTKGYKYLLRTDVIYKLQT